MKVRVPAEPVMLYQTASIFPLPYLPLRDFDDVTNALNFDTADCHVIGGCDLYTTKAAGGDKKLYRTIESSLESQYESLLRLSASLSPPHANSAAASLNLSRASPFGPLSQISSRRTFAYLIATLNASHPDYDFSHLLRPSDFRREKSLKSVMNTLDSTLYNLRPRHTSSFLSVPSHWSSTTTSTGPTTPGGSQAWGPRMWRLIDKEMTLKECSIYCYSPEEDPYDGEEGAIWSFNYFFFNKARKRVCYIYLRGLSIMSHSPVQRTPVKTKRSSDGEWSRSEGQGASKRARYWLGDKAEDVSGAWGEDDEDEVIGWGDDEVDVDGVVDDGDEPRYIVSADEDNTARARSRSKSTVRDISEDIAESMEV
ncbi:MAG: RNA polymerase III-inhibiting protein maf1 [Pleopsidium flavum]|nr:MAG: RNA polymerase III-inhibiting protein maf1 [Pleopsidium flavum]